MSEFVKMCLIVYGICIGIPLLLFLLTITFVQNLFFIALIVVSIYCVKEYVNLTT